MEVEVRLIKDEDTEALAEVYELASAFIDVDRGEDRVATFREKTAGELVLVAECDNQVVGFASIFVEDSFLHNLYVHPNHHRKGVGTALLSACAPHFKGKASLKCVKTNTGAMQFYRSQGWVLQAETDLSLPYVVFVKS